MTLLIVALAAVALLTLVGRLRRSAAWPDYSVWLLLGLLAVGFHWRLVAGDAYAPAGGGDLASFLYPYYLFASRSLHGGELPLWNPYAFSGMPFVGDVQNGLFYPINLLLFALRPEPGYADVEALAIIHLWLAGGFTFTALRYWPRLRLGRAPALVGAVAFMFSDLFVMHFGNLNMIAVAVWLPLVLLLFALALEGGSAALAAWSGAALGVSALAGHIQPTIYNGLVLALLAAYGCRRAGPTLKERLRPLGLLLLAAAVAICLSSPITFPSLVLSAHTPRADFTYWEASPYSLAPLRLLGLAFPDLTGRDPDDYWGLGDRVETGYLGVLPLMLAAGTLWCLRRRPWVGFFGLTAAVSLCVALGDSLPVHGWLYTLVPGLDLLRAPARALYVTDFALAALAAVAVREIVSRSGASSSDAWCRFLRVMEKGAAFVLPLALTGALLAVMLMQDRDPVIFSRAWQAADSVSRTALFVFVSLLLLRAALPALRWSPPAWVAAVVAVTFLDLASVGAYVDLGRTDPTAAFDHPAAVAFLRGDPNPFRVDVDPGATSLWPPGMGLVHGVEHVRGVANPMELSRFRQFMDLAGQRDGDLYRLLGAKYLVMAKGQVPAEPGLEIAFGEDPEVDIYVNANALPLVSVVGRSVAVDGPATAAEAMSSAGFDPTREVVIEGDAPSTAGSASVAELFFRERRTSSLTVGVTVTEPAYLLLSVPYCPGWTATLDGKSVTLYAADLAWSAVYLPAGSHTVALSYAPPLFLPSLGLALSAVVALSGLTARQWSRKRTSVAS